MNTESIKQFVCLLGGYDKTELEKYLFLIENVCERIRAQLCSACDESDPSVGARLNYLAACRVCYEISLTADASGDNVTSFKAGDISVSKDANLSSGARKLLENAENMCSSLLRDSAFAFREV